MKIVLKVTLNSVNRYLYSFLFGILIFILSNQYFGWNRTAQSGAEKVWDFIWQALVLYGGFGLAVAMIIRDHFKATVYRIEIKK